MKSKFNTVKLSLTSVALLMLLSGCNDKKSEDDPKDTQNYSITSTIEWTSYGVPHITGDNYSEVGAGLGYVMAQDKLCNYAQGIVTAKGERAKYLGAGENEQNIDSDFAYRHLGTYQEAQQVFAHQDQRVKQLMLGFAKGYNFWLTQNPNHNQSCAALVKPIDHIDLLALNLSIRYWPFIGNYTREMARAQPQQRHPASSVLNKQFSLVEKMKGSNGWAIGKDMTASGKGLLLSNTHLSHKGKFAWYEAHMTIPGQLDVYGGFLPGLMTPALGFNKQFAWTHTWTASSPGSFYILNPSATDPLAYQYGEQVKPLTATTYEIQVKQSNNQLTSQSRTLYKSHYGPVLAFTDDGNIISAKDAPSLRADQSEYWLKLALSQNIQDAINLNIQGYRTGSQNIVMTDSSGQTFYADMAAVPDLSANAWSIIESVPALKQSNGSQLDGSNPIFEWSDVVPFERVPKRYSDNYVQNANESAWLANIEAPIEEYSPLYGRINREQSPRTRLSLALLEQFKQSQQKVELQDLQSAMANKRLFLAELTTDELVNRCTAYPEVVFQEEKVDLTQACNTLKNWDKTANMHSVGAHIFREYALNLSNFRQEFDLQYWQTAFDPKQPISTPRGLPVVVDANNDVFLIALALAVKTIEAANIDFTSPLTDIQQLVKGERSLPISGGFGDITGSFATIGADMDADINYLSASGLNNRGYHINSGDGFVFIAGFNEQGVTAKSVLYYSQSNNPDSEHYFDQAPLIEQAVYKDVKFTRDDIKADKNYRSTALNIE